jgi:hypothetical protein
VCPLKGILTILFIYGWIPLAIVQTSVLSQQSVRVWKTKKGAFNFANMTDSFKLIFKEPCETLVIIFKDGSCLLFSEGREESVEISAGMIETLLKELSYRMADIEIIIHNHLKPEWFSPQDKKFCHQLVKFGFKGKFLVYFPSRNKTIEYSYKKENRVFLGKKD